VSNDKARRDAVGRAHTGSRAVRIAPPGAVNTHSAIARLLP
jgi:hypothetical protein